MKKAQDATPPPDRCEVELKLTTGPVLAGVLALCGRQYVDLVGAASAGLAWRQGLGVPHRR